MRRELRKIEENLADYRVGGGAQQALERAIAREGPARDAFVASACGDDQTLRAEVESLLARHRPGEPGRLEALQ